MEEEKGKKKGGKMKVDNSSGALYGMGVIGALIYYLLHATNFWMGVLGIIKALLWPAVLVYTILDMLKL